VRTVGTIAMLALAALASADRLIYIPTARKIPFGSFKYEIRGEPRVQGEFENYLGVGLTTAWEIAFQSSNLGLDRQVGSVDLSYNLLSPITGFTPGFSFGIQDLFNRTSDGRRPYFVTTFKEGFYVIGGEVPGEITIGISGVKKRIYPLVGVSIPFSNEVRLLAEHDGMRISAGAEVRPIRSLGVRFIVREKSSLFGLQFQARF
jgi:hypothetical protein